MPIQLSRRGVLAGMAGVAAAPAAEAGCRPPGREFEVTETTLVVPGIDPAHHGLKLAQLSDIHVGRSTPEARILSAIEAVNRAKPDLVVLTGDFLTTSRRPLVRIAYLLRGIEAPAAVVLGNHDHRVDPRGVRRQLEALGYAVLQNANTTITLRGAPAAILGVDDAVTRHDDVAATFKGAPDRGTRIVLAHSPPTANKLQENGGLVCLSGHTHGGHFVIPGLTGALFRTAGQPYLRGLYQVRGNFLYVNRGLGFGARVGSEPEVSVITLRAA